MNTLTQTIVFLAIFNVVCGFGIFMYNNTPTDSFTTTLLNNQSVIALSPEASQLMSSDNKQWQNTVDSSSTLWEKAIGDPLAMGKIFIKAMFVSVTGVTPKNPNPDDFSETIASLIFAFIIAVINILAIASAYRTLKNRGQ